MAGFGPAGRGFESHPGYHSEGSQLAPEGSPILWALRASLRPQGSSTRATAQASPANPPIPAVKATLGVAPRAEVAYA